MRETVSRNLLVRERNSGLPQDTDPLYDQDDCDSWNKRNMAFYGYLMMAMPPALKGSLNTHSKFDGLASLKRLKARFAVQDVNDRADAMMRIYKSYISPQSEPSTKDVSRQYDMMTAAHIEYTSAGGADLDDEMLRTLFLSALPNTSSYQNIKLLVKSNNVNYNDFSELYDATLNMVKGVEDDEKARPNSGFYNSGSYHSSMSPDQWLAQQDPNLSTSQALALFAQSQRGGGKGKGKGKGGKGGRGKGAGRGGSNQFVICVRCSLVGHGRGDCPAAIVSCSFCSFLLRCP